MFNYSMTVYSASLILVGCSFKIILHYFLNEDEQERESTHVNNHSDEEEKMLLLQHEKQLIANLYSWSLALSFVALDAMNISHRGVAENCGLMFRPDGTFAWIRIGIGLVDYGLIAACACLSMFSTMELETLVLAGLVLVVAQTLLRTRGMRYFPVSKAAMARQKRWPNQTETRIAEQESS
jgi:hypothetical protein